MQRLIQQRLWRRIWLAAAVMAICAVLACAARIAFVEWQGRHPRFHDQFDRDADALPIAGGWQAFGGTWQAIGNTMQNISDDRGGKLMNGNSRWRDYMVDADVQLLSETGDAGFDVRATGEEIGVDAYHGYFAGLRDLDDTLILGRADYGWHEFQAVPVHSRVHTRTWYHLRVIAVGCVIAASATTPEGEQTVASIHDRDCVRAGRFGLQSYSTGAVWRNVDLRPATEADLAAVLGGQPPTEPTPPLVDSAGLPIAPPFSDLAAYQHNFAPMQRELRDNHADPHATPIANLRLLAPNVSPHVTVHGVVTLVSPILFIQDSSGGIAIPNAHTVIPVQIGDAVEASGDAELHSFSSVLRSATVRLLWSHTQVPAVAVTASQAATGGFDAQFIETEGRLTSIERMSPASVQLRFDEGSQSFVAIAESPSRSGAMGSLKAGSRLRVRGICVTDRKFTGDEVPFAVLLRSAGDAQMLAPPPWWNVPHVVELAMGLLALSLCLQVLYTSVERSRLRAVMEERERLAMEMHDTLAQSFAGLGFQLEALCEEARSDGPMHEQLKSTLELVRFGHLQARRNIAALRPANLEELGLVRALEQAAQTIVRDGRVEVRTLVRGEARAIPLRLADPLFRIGQEAIANAVRHAVPRQIVLRILFGKTTVTLTVRDDGRGFDPEAGNAGFGIRCMNQRAERIAANLRIRSSPGRGTVVTVRVKSPRPMISAALPMPWLWRWGGRVRENTI